MQFLLDPQHNPAAESRLAAEVVRHRLPHDTPRARNFDLLLVLAIIVSVLVIMADSVGWVGFGDIAPQTTLGRLVTLILIGYSIIAVPTGIYTAELAFGLREANSGELRDRRRCPECGLEGHEPDARHCRRCGHSLPAPMG